MSGRDFSKALLRSARELDIPAEGAKARALAHGGSRAIVAGATVGAAGSVAGGAAAVTSGKLLMFAASLAAASSIAAGAYVMGRRSGAPEPAVTVAPA